MFQLVQSPTYWWPVHVIQPTGGDQAGKVGTIVLEVEYHRLDEDGFDALCKQIAATKPKDRALAAQLMKAFRHQPEGSDSKVAYSSPEQVAQLLNVPGAGSAIVNAFFESRAPAAEKN